MKHARKLLAIMLTAMLIMELFSEVRTEAAETEIPKISLKHVNSKTGVKISIGKTEGAEAYVIYLKGYGNSYADYWTDRDKNDWWREMAVIGKNGTAKRTYTIKGLPKGTYSIKVSALQKDPPVGTYFYDGAWYDEVFSAEKTIKIKAPQTVEKEEKTYNFSKVKVGDTITFGSYEQDGIMTNGKEDIEWIVFSKNKSEMLVVSKYALDSVPYHIDGKKLDLTWQDCTLRKWLNNNFYKTAFTQAERSLIKKINLENPDNPEYGTEGGNYTKDKVFLLSLNDMINTKYGFSSDFNDYDIARRCAATAYAKVQGVYPLPYNKTADGEDSCTWWLRSPGRDTERSSSAYAADVCPDGNIFPCGDCVDVCSQVGVRPVLYISLKS